VSGLKVVYRVRFECGAVVEAVLDDVELISRRTWCPLCRREERFEVLKRNVPV